MVRRLFPWTALLLLWLSSCADPAYGENLLSQVGGVEIRRHHIQGLEYVEVVPEGCGPEEELPMVVFLHGRADRPHMPHGPFLDLDVPVRVILPRAPEPFGDGYSWLSVSASGGESAELVRSLEERSAQLARAIAQLQQRHPTLGGPIVTGFSQGGILSMQLAVNHPEVIGAAFPVAGWLPPSMHPRGPRTFGRPPLVRALHGRDDDILPADRTEQAVERLNHRGIPIELRVVGGDHTMTGEMRDQLRRWLEEALEERWREAGSRGVSYS